MATFYDDIQTALQLAVTRYGSIRRLAETLEMNPSTISKWLETKEKTPKRSPNLRELAPIMDLMEVRVVIPVSYAEKLSEPATADGDLNINDLKRQLTESEAARLSLAGEVKALERQLARLMPTPSVPAQSDDLLTVVKPLALDENEQPSSGLKTANE